mgnify:CR=1 FL=1
MESGFSKSRSTTDAAVSRASTAGRPEALAVAVTVAPHRVNPFIKSASRGEVPQTIKVVFFFRFICNPLTCCDYRRIVREDNDQDRSNRLFSAAFPVASCGRHRSSSG